MRCRPWLWISLSLLLFGSGLLQASPQNTSPRVKVVAEQANIRLRPSITSIIIYQAPQGSIFKLIAKEGEWYKIEFQTETGETSQGFVHESLVVRLEPKKRITSPAKKSSPPSPPPVPSTKEPPPKKKQPPEKPSKTLPVVIKKRPPSTPPPPPPQPQPSPRPQRLFIGLQSGALYFNGGDINSGTVGLAKFYQDYLGVKPTEPVNQLHFTYLFGLRVAYALTSQIRIGVGFDYWKKNAQSQLTYSSGTTPESLFIRPEIRALPIHLFLSLYPTSHLYFRGSLDLYRAEVNYHYRLSTGETWTSWTGESSTHDLGFTFALGWQFKLAPYLEFFSEIAGQYARLDNFQGENIYRESSGFESQEKGTLYLYQAQVTAQLAHPLLFIREKKPTEAGVAEARIAYLSLSGVAVRLGLRFRF